MSFTFEQSEMDWIVAQQEADQAGTSGAQCNAAAAPVARTATRPEVVILGGGFGGLNAAKALKKSPVNVTLVDQHNYHLFQPLLYQAATAALTPAEIASPVRGILRDQKNTTVYMDTITGIDKQARTVQTRSGRAIHYDYLVIATGARHSYFNNDHWAEVAPGLKSLDDAMKLRHRILLAFEQAEMEKDADRRHAFLTYVIVGAGPTGVEMAGAIAELGHSIAHDFRNVSTRCAHVMLVEAGDRVLPQFAPALSAKAKRNLESLGVEVLTGVRVEQIERGWVTLNQKRIATETVIWAAGVQASPAGIWLNGKTDRAGRVLVNQDLSLPQHPEIFVIGDTAAFTPKDSERPLPGVAPVAKQQGHFVGRLIDGLVRGRDSRPSFKYRDYGSMATIGRNHAIADIWGLHISGIIGWFLWGFAHVFFLIGFRNQLRVSFSWLWAYITYQRGARLITGMGFNTEENDHEQTDKQEAEQQHSETDQSGAAGRGVARRVRMGSTG